MFFVTLCKYLLIVDILISGEANMPSTKKQYPTNCIGFIQFKNFIKDGDPVSL